MSKPPLPVRLRIVDKMGMITAAAWTRWLNFIHGRFTGDPGSATVIYGAGAPEGNVEAVVGSLYLRTDGGATTTLYVKESGTGLVGWIAK